MRKTLIITAFTDKKLKDNGINRKELVKRHIIKLETIDNSKIPQVGNGGIDIMGLQTLSGNTLSH